MSGSKLEWWWDEQLEYMLGWLWDEKKVKKLG